MELDMNRRHKHQRRRHSNIVYADTLKKRDHVEDFTQALAEVLSELKKEYDDYAKKAHSSMNEYGVFGSEINQVRAELMVVAKARRNATAKVIKKRAAAKMRAKGKQLHKAKESPQTYEALMSLEERKRKLKEVFHKVMLLNDKFERELHRSLGENTLNSKYREKMSKMIKLDAAQILEGSLAPSPVELSPRHGVNALSSKRRKDSSGADFSQNLQTALLKQCIDAESHISTGDSTGTSRDADATGGARILASPAATLTPLQYAIHDQSRYELAMEKQRAEEENKKGSEFTNKGLAMLVFGERKKSRANEQCTQEANAEDETGALTEQVPAQGSTTQPPLMYPFDTVNRGGFANLGLSWGEVGDLLRGRLLADMPFRQEIPHHITHSHLPHYGECLKMAHSHADQENANTKENESRDRVAGPDGRRHIGEHRNLENAGQSSNPRLQSAADQRAYASTHTPFSQGSIANSPAIKRIMADEVSSISLPHLSLSSASPSRSHPCPRSRAEIGSSRAPALSLSSPSSRSLSSHTSLGNIHLSQSSSEASFRANLDLEKEQNSSSAATALSSSSSLSILRSPSRSRRYPPQPTFGKSGGTRKDRSKHGRKGENRKGGHVHGFNHRSDEIKASDADSRRKFKHQHSRPSFSHVRANKNQRTALSTNNYRAVKESLARKSRQRRAHDDKRWRNANSPLKTDKRSRVGGEYIHSSFAKLMERRTVDQCKAEGNKLNKYRNWAKDFVADNEDAVSHESLGDAWGRTTNYHTSKRREEKNKRKKGKKKIGSQKDVMINHTLAMLNAIADSASTTSQSIKAHTHPHTAQIETTINNSSTSTVGKIDGLQNSHSEKRLHAQNQSTSKSLSKSYSAVELRHPSSSSSVLSSSALAPIPKTSSTYVSSLSTAPLQSLAQTHSDHPSLAVPSMSPVDLTAFALFAPSTTSKSMEATLSVSRPVQTFKHEGRFYDQPSLDRKDGARGAKSATDSGSGAQHHRREASFGQAQLRGSHDVSEENEGNAEAGETGVGRLHLLSAKNHDLLHWDQNQNQHQQENQYSRKKTDGYCGDKNGVKTVPSSSLPPSVVDDAHSRERMGPSPSDSTDNKERPRLFSDITSHIEEYNAKQRVVMAEVDESIRAVVNHREKYCNDLANNTLSVVKVASADRGSNLFRSYPSDNSRGNESGTGNGNSGDVRERRSGRDSRGSHLRGSRNGSQFPTKEVFGRGAPGRKGDSLGLLDRMRHEKEADEERKNEQLLNQYHARHSRSVSRLRLNWPRNITLRALHQTGEGTAKGGESIAQSISLNTPHSLGDRAADANNGEIVDSTTKRRGGEGLPGVRAIMLGGKGNFYADPVTTEKQQQMMVMLEGRTSEARTRQETGSEQGDHETIDGRSNHRCNENGKDSANASLKTLAAKYNIACRLQTEVSLSSGDIKTYMDVSNMGRRFSAIEQERLSEQNKRTKTDVGSSQGSESSLRAVDTVHAEGQARDSSRAQPSSSDLSSLAQTKTKATPNSDVSTLITRPFEVPVLLDLPKSHVSVGSPIEGAMGNQVSYTVPAQEWDVNSEDHGAFIARLEKSSKVLRKQENFLILVRRRQNQLKEWVKQTQREDEAREKAEKKARREKSKRKTNNPEGSDGDDADSDEDDGADEDEDESFERKSVYTGSDRSMGGTEEDKEKTGVSKPDDGSRGKVKRAGRAKHTSKQRLMTYTEAHKIASVIEAANRNKIKIDITSMMGSVDKLMIRNIKRTLAEQDITNLETEILTHLLQYGHMPRKVIDNTPIPSVANRIVRLLKNARQVEYRASSEYWLMLVCDDESYRDELTSLLSEFGYRHVLEYSTQSYFHVLQQYPSRFDLVLLDNTVAGRDALFQIKNTPTLEHTKVAMIASAKNHRDSASLSGYTIADASGYGESDGVTSGVVGVDGMQPNGNVNSSKHITKTVLNMQQRLTAPPLPSSASEAKKKVSEKMAKIMEERKAPDVTKLIKNGADCIVWTWEFSTDYKELLTSKLNQAASSSCRNDLSGTASAVDTGEGNGKKAESSAGAGGPSSHAVVHGDEKGQDGKNDPLCRQTQNMPEAVKLYTSLVQDNPSLANMISCQNNTLEIRLMRVWRMCRFNNIHRMEMMGKYSQPAYVHLLSDALILWELLIQLVEFRFALLEKHHEEGLHTGAFLSFPPSGLELQANMHRRRKTPLFCLPASVTDSDLTLRERKKRLGVFLGALAVKREEAATAADRIRRAEEEISKIGTTSQAETMSTNLNSESGAIAVGVMGGLRRKSSVVMKRGRPSSVNAPALSDLALLTSAATERRKSTEKRKNKKNVKRMSTSTAAKRKGGGRAAGSITLPRMKRRGVSLFQTNIPEHGRADSRVESGSDSTNDSDSDTTSSEEEEEVKEIELVEDKNGYGDKYGDSYGPDYEEYMIIQSRSSVNAETDNQRTVDGTSISEQHASTGGTKKDGREVLTGVGGGSGDISDTKLKRRESAAGIDNTHTQDQGKNSRKSSLSDSSAVNTIRRRAGVPQDTRSQSFPLPSSSSPLTQSVTSPPFLYKPGLSLSSSAETSSTHLGINMESRVASVWYDHTERRDRVRARSLKYYDDLINRPLIEEESSTKSQNDGDRDSDNEDDGGWKKEWKKAKALSKSRSAPRLSALGVLARSNGKGATSPANKAMSPLMRALTGEKTTRRPSINILLKLKTTSSKVRMMDRRRSVIREQSIASSASPSLLTKSSGESLAKKRRDQVRRGHMTPVRMAQALLRASKAAAKKRQKEGKARNLERKGKMSLLKKMVMSAVMKTMDKNKGSNAKNHSSVSDNDADITSDEEVETMESLKRKDMLTRSFSTGNLLDYKSTLRVDQVVSVARAKQGLIVFKELQQQRKKKQKKRAEERVIALQKQRAASTPHNLTPMKEGQRQTSLYTALDDSVGQGSVLRSDSLEMGNAGNDSATSLPSRAGQHPIHPEDGDIGNEDIGVSDGGTADDNKQSIGSENKRRRTGRRSGSGRRMNVLVVEGKGKGNSLVKEMDSDTSEAIQSIKNFAKSFSLGHEPTLFGKGMARAKEYFGVETLARVGEGVPLLDSVLESRFVNEIACSRRRARSHTGASPSESVKVNLLRSLGSLASPSLWQKVPETSNRKGHKQPQRYKQLHARGKKANVSKCIYHIGIKLPDTLQKCLPPTLKTPFLSHFRFLHRRGDRRVIHSARGFQTKPKTALQLVAEREEAKARARVEKQREKEDGKGGHRQLSLQLRLKLGRACGGNKAETGRSGKSANSGLWKKLAASASPEPPTSDAIMHFHKDYLRHFLSLPPELRVLEKRRIARLKERKRTFQLRLKRFEQYRTQHMNETRAKDEDEHLTSMKEVQRKDEHRLAVEKAKKMELERQRKQRRAKSVGLCSFQRFKRNARKIMVKRSIIGLLKGSQASTDAGTEIKKEADPSLCTKGADNSNLKVKTTASNGEEGGGDVNEELGKGTGESTENKRKSVSFGSRPDVNGKEGHVPRNGQDRTKMLQRSVDEAGARATVKVSPMNGNESDGAGVDLSSSDEDDSLDKFSLTKKQSADEFEEDSIDSDSDVDMCDDIVHFKQFELDQLSLDIVKYVNILLRKFHDPFMWQGQPYGLIYNSCN